MTTRTNHLTPPDFQATPAALADLDAAIEVARRTSSEEDSSGLVQS